MKKLKLTMPQMSFLALAAVLNIIGANLALFLKLPFYMDTLGTFLAAMLFGSIYSMIPGLLSGLLMGFTTDIYSLFFLPVQLIIGLTAGFFFHNRKSESRVALPFYALLVSLPGTVVSACISAFVFGGITSSGSTVFVQLLHRTGLNLTASVFCVQFLTDYIDRAIMLLVAALILGALPNSILGTLKKGCHSYGSLQ